MAIKKVCHACGSDEVKFDAWAEWDEVDQKYELSQTFDEAFCENCAGETRVVDVQIS